MENITYVISDLIYKKYNATRIAQHLLNKGYTAEEIKTALAERNLKKRNINKPIGIMMLVIGVIANLYTSSTYFNNHFRFDFFSQTDFMLFNERILKPTITLAMIFLGVNLLIDRTRVSRSLKNTLLVLLTVFLFTITSYYSVYAIIFSSISIILVAFLEMPQKIKSREIQDIFIDFNNHWKGTVGYVFLLLGIVLVYSSEINFVYVKTGERTSTATFGFIDYFILYVKPYYGLLGIVTSLLLSIDLKKFKIALYIYAGITALFILACLLHKEFQNLIYGTTIIMITSIIIVFTNRNRIQTATPIVSND